MSDIVPQNTPQNNSKPETTFIYVLIDPETHEVRYVGKADDPARRLRGHLGKPRDTSHKQCWINSLKDRGLKPLLQIIEEVPLDSWQERECYWIGFYQEQGCNLTNTKPGGIGGNHTPETRAKIGAAKKGKTRQEPPRTKEWCENISKAKRGKKPTPEQAAKGAATRRGLKRSPETRAKQSAAHLGKKHSEERKANMSEGLRKAMANPEVRAKISARQKGKKLSPESIEKRSAKQRGVARSPETKAKISAAKMGKKRPPEVVERIASKRRGRKQPPEVVAKIALGLRRYHATKKLPPSDDSPTLWSDL